MRMIVARPLRAFLPLMLTTTALAAPVPQATDSASSASAPVQSQSLSSTTAPAVSAVPATPSVTAPTSNQATSDTAAPSKTTRPGATQNDTTQPGVPQAQAPATVPVQPVPAQPTPVQPKPAAPVAPQPVPETRVQAAPAPVVDATPPLPTSCLQIATDSAQSGEGAFDATQYIATVPGTDIRLTISRLDVDDPGHHLSASDARGLAALAALGAVSAAGGRTPAGCQDATTSALAHTLSSDVAAGAAPHIVWRGVALQHGAHTMTATEIAANVRPDDGSGLLRLTATANGVAETGADRVIPSQASVDLSAPASAIASIGGLSTPIPVTVRALHVTVPAPSGDVTLEGNGRATVAPDPHDTNADGRVTVTNLPALIDVARHSGQSMLTTAMSVGQLVGHRSGDQTSWDIKYADDLILINNIPLPLSVH
ncbi:hypothetical protein [Tanticharoenia sakaeratensis]|uniref:hypothetical protein n=1 Tax=Tanticharoenia sakaeratensis TaxID=444053 RepID=UPI0011DCD652|nr:hypothetical protein [Tanticharoenia sakaeratensis]